MSAEGEEYIVSVHESGHAVAAAVAGMEIREVVLHRAGSHQDEAGRCELRDIISECDADLSRFLIYVFSGAAAERRAFGHSSVRDAGDREYARKLARLALEEVDPASPRVAELLQNAELIADARMNDRVVWKWVERVADALRKRRRLSHRDIHELRPREAQ